jgi:hypothetical protein
MATAREQGLTLFEGLAKLAGAHSALSNPNARMTVLAPTDEARSVRCSTWLPADCTVSTRAAKFRMHELASQSRHVFVPLAATSMHSGTYPACSSALS